MKNRLCKYLSRLFVKRKAAKKKTTMQISVDDGKTYKEMKMANEIEFGESLKDDPFKPKTTYN